jgi:tetratricopeptide (TPR) repeat protein
MGQTAHQQLRQADRLYEDEQFLEAEKKYQSAAETKPSAQAHYNWGNALYEQEAYPEAIQQFEKSLSLAEGDEQLMFAAHHNAGNAHAQSQQWEDAISSYKEALKLRPDHQPTKENLWRAMGQMLPPQQQDQSASSEEGKEDKKEEKEASEKQGDESEAGEQQEEQAGGRPADDRPVSKEELERLLQAVEREDARVQESRRRKGERDKMRPVRDW